MSESFDEPLLRQPSKLRVDGHILDITFLASLELGVILGHLFSDDLFNGQNSIDRPPITDCGLDGFVRSKSRLKPHLIEQPTAVSNQLRWNVRLPGCRIQIKKAAASKLLCNSRRKIDQANAAPHTDIDCARSLGGNNAGQR